jgi:WD40 repeat protein
LAIGLLSISPTLNAQHASSPQPKEVTVLRGHTNAVWGLALSPDGQTAVTGSFDKTIKLWDVSAGKERFTLRGHSRCVEFVVLSPDRRTAYAADQKGTIRVWDLTAQRECRKPTETGGRPGFLSLSADGRTLSLGDRNYFLRQWDVTTGKELVIGGPRRVSVKIVSPDGRLGADTNEKPTRVEIIDLPSGRVVGTLPAREPCAFSSDGKTLFATDEMTGDVWLWELATGLVRATTQNIEQRHIGMVAVHPHGRLLALPKEERKALMLIDLVTCQAVADIRIDNDLIHRFAFSADGRVLAVSEAPDTTIRIWDVSELAKSLPRKEQFTPAELEALWADLAGLDGPRAWQAIWALAGSMKHSAAWLGERLKPIVAADDKRTAKLIVELDHNRFPTRDRATRELEDLGDAAAPALRQALTANPSPEVRERIEVLLRRLDSLPPDRLRSLRAIEALEYSGAAEARILLGKLAGGLAEAQLTREAKGAVERLDRR